MGYGIYLGWNSDALRLQTIQVLGNSHVTGEELRSASRLKRGVHLVKLSTSAVQKRVESIAWIASARVERIIPSKIRITVKERKPFILVAESGKSFLVDRTGVVLAEGTEPRVLLQGLPSKDLHPGSHIEGPEFAAVVLIVGDLPAELRSQVVSINAPSIDQITLALSDSTSVIYGAAEDRADKNDAVLKLWNEYRSKGQPPASIDVRVPSRPAVRPR